MATKTAKTRNSERHNGKAWSKGHVASAKPLSEEARARRAERDAKRGRAVRAERGSSLTMPRITWGWAEEVMAARWPSTRRVRMMDAVLAQERGRSGDFPVIEPNPEAKASRKNGR